jgi:hypothetical protein
MNSTAIKNTTSSGKPIVANRYQGERKTSPLPSARRVENSRMTKARSQPYFEINGPDFGSYALDRECSSFNTQPHRPGGFQDGGEQLAAVRSPPK